jgi:hypothetical protein
MKAATVSELKKELSTRSPKELLELCLRLSKFKKENKELLTYLLYEASNETGFVESIKREMDQEFELINTQRFYFIKKSVRKILRNVKKYIRYSKNKETEVDLLIYFCTKLKNFSPSIKRNITLNNLYQRQISMIRKTVSTLDEDLQYDYEMELEDLI